PLGGGTDLRARGEQLGAAMGLTRRRGGRGGGRGAWLPCRRCKSGPNALVAPTTFQYAEGNLRLPRPAGTRGSGAGCRSVCFLRPEKGLDMSRTNRVVR